MKDSIILGRFTPAPRIIRADRTEELKACHERIDELKACVAELVGVYWGEGDGIDPPPGCIQRALAALSEDVTS